MHVQETPFTGLELMSDYEHDLRLYGLLYTPVLVCNHRYVSVILAESYSSLYRSTYDSEESTGCGHMAYMFSTVQVPHI